jgi:succinate dehydrogenase hydrophobic anchor subunit
MKAVAIIFMSVFVIILIALGIFSAIGYSQGTSTQFADVAIFVLTLVGLLVTLASVAMWTTLRTILGDQIHTEISKAEEESKEAIINANSC